MNRIQITDLSSLPEICGIYKVTDGKNNVLYIGQAKNIHLRWNQGHHKIGKILEICGTNAYITWIQIPEWLLNRAENAAVSAYKPLLNLKTPPIV